MKYNVLPEYRVSIKRCAAVFAKFLWLQTCLKAGTCFFQNVGSIAPSTTTFLYNIREPRYKQIKMGHHISRKSNIG